jgi:obg-like ATPase 1
MGPGEQSPGNHLRLGLLGYPNSGKTSLYNALVNPDHPASTEDFMFCTLDTIIGKGEVTDTRVDWLKSVFNCTQTSRVPFSIIDGPALVPGSFSGAGEGFMPFMHKYREVEVFVHVLRAFDDGEISHWENGVVDPIRDAKLINNELMRQDLDEIDKRLKLIEGFLDDCKKNYTPVGSRLLIEVRTLRRAWECLTGLDRIVLTDDEKSILKRKGKSTEIKYNIPEILGGCALRLATWAPVEVEILKSFNFFSAKEMVYVLNISDRDHVRGYSKWQEPVRQALDSGTMGGGLLVPLSCKFEWELRVEERAGTIATFFAANPQSQIASQQRGVAALLAACCRQLDLVFFYTTKNDEVKVYACRQGTNIKDSADLVDHETCRLFMRAEIYSYDDLVEFKGNLPRLNEVGRHRHQTKGYDVNDGDVITFRIWKK